MPPRSTRSPAAPLPVAPSRRSGGFLLVYAFAYAGGVIGYLPLLTLLLPVKIEEFAGEARIGVLTATIVAGAIASSLSNILFGWLTDRALARGGGRRRWLAGGTLATALSYGGLAAAGSPVAVVIAIVLFQTAVNALLAPLVAIMADEVPDAQKGVAGGLLALANPVASMLSTLLVGVGAMGEAARFGIVPLAIALCVLPLLMTAAQPVAASTQPRVEHDKRRDLAVAWGARLLVQVAGNVLALYMLYYFESVASGEPPAVLASRVGHVLTLAYIIPLPVAVLAGRVSDRLRRRKPFLFGAAAISALGLIGMALARSWPAGAAAFGVYAVGSSVFLALHAAFAMQLLPNPRHRGRDLGLLNLTNTLPALLATPLTWLLATPRDFGPLMLSLAGLALAGGVIMLAVREPDQPRPDQRRPAAQ